MATPSDTPFVDLTLERAIKLAADESTATLLRELSGRITAVLPEMARFREWCDRADLLYYADNFSQGGADIWPDDPNLQIAGRTHVSVNTPAAYVDIPAALQAVEPQENFLATDTTKSAREAAAHFERLYYAWKRDQDYALKFHKACTVKGLYGRTAGKVYWDADDKKPCVEIIEQPRNLYLGWKSDNYEHLEWAAYVSRVEPNSVIERFGVDVTSRDWEGTTVPFVQTYTLGAIPARPWLFFGDARIEVWDYWYRKPVPRRSAKPGPVKMEVWNVVFAGNAVVQGPTRYPEYDGRLPYVPLYNTFVPGVPTGRGELYDMEQLIREKYERITGGAQMIHQGVAGDYWQLTGADAPAKVPPGLKPRRNEVIAPGAGNRIETITPFIAQFQLEQYLGRLDREMAVVSGLNDLLLGLAPAQVLSSSKAINALIANYESRLSMRRRLLYAWRRDIWKLAVKVWSNKDKTVNALVAAGGGTLDVIDPSLSPRDELETATKAANLVGAKLWSQRRAMDAVGVDDPETEQELIREERTDATLFPADVQVMAQLLAALQSLGLQPNQATQQAAGMQFSRGESDLRNALGAATPDNTTSMQAPEEQGMMPPEAMSTGGNQPGAPFASPPSTSQAEFTSPTNAGLSQTRIVGGKANSRIVTQQMLGRR